MIKDAYDDIRRHLRDKKHNEKKYQVLCTTSDKTIYWKLCDSKKIRVGDFVKVDNDREFPCDLLAVASTNPTREINVTTANLDGETNLKKFKPINSRFEYLRKVTANFDQESNAFRPLEDKYDYSLTVNYQSPTKELDKFEGGATTQEGQTFNFEFENFLLRGAKLKQTEFVVGIAVYTGLDTKLSLNTKKAEKKYSVTERKINDNILVLLLVVGLLVLLIKILEFAYFDLRIGNQSWYLPERLYTPWSYAQEFINCLLIFTYLIPISIIVSFEINQLFAAAVFINKDYLLYDAETDIHGVANTTSLADQLGQIEFLFSDKTGTLTKNEMKFKACTILPEETVYIKEEDCLMEKQMTYSRNKFSDSDELSLNEDLESDDESDSSSQLGIDDPISRPHTPYHQLQDSKVTAFSPKLKEFWTLVAICNTVVVSDDNSDLSTPIYNVSSPFFTPPLKLSEITLEFH
ncbi:Phospholipid-transporting ATPase IB [Cichlidogyrus casuarinus]|uniref:Phospholipid-transporting ATPase IB n=1 Tax=Cichlidogyrus casuarinus TaxID=1844966 RepID=A0ABD2QHM8_9PLAT